MGNRLSPYGKRIIGEEAAAEQKQIRKTKSHIYGKRVLGETADAVEKKPLSLSEQTQSRILTENVCVHEFKEYESVEEIDGVQTRVTRTVCANEACGEQQGETRYEPIVVKADVDPELLKRGAGADNRMNLDELEVVLKENPAAVEDLLIAELEREEGARKGALRLLREAEGARDGGPRADVIGLIDATLAKLSAPPTAE